MLQTHVVSNKLADDIWWRWCHLECWVTKIVFVIFARRLYIENMIF